MTARTRPAGERSRLDVELVRRGLVSSRTRAAALVAAGRVEAAGAAVHRAAVRVDAGTALRVLPAPPADPDRVSRGGRKLAAALAAFGVGAAPLTVTGRRCLDAGASTGGFTEVLLHAGASHVAAVDVGHGQLVEALRLDPRVTAQDGRNVRDLLPADLGGPVDLAVVDLSFISLRLVLPALAACIRPAGDLVALVKPQFEVGRERLGRGGVVRDGELHADALRTVVRAAATEGLAPRGLIRSPVAGQHGNAEFLLWLARAGGRLDVERAIDAVVAT